METGKPLGSESRKQAVEKQGKHVDLSLLEESATSAQRTARKPGHLADLRNNRRIKPRDASTAKRGSGAAGIDISDISIIRADDLCDPRWSDGSRYVSSGDRAASGDSPRQSNPAEVEAVDLFPASQKRHKVNQLALDARRNDAELLEKAASGKQKQRSTAMKYGW